MSMTAAINTGPNTVIIGINGETGSFLGHFALQEGQMLHLFHTLSNTLVHRRSLPNRTKQSMRPSPHDTAAGPLLMLVLSMSTQSFHPAWLKTLVHVWSSMSRAKTSRRPLLPDVTPGVPVMLPGGGGGGGGGGRVYLFCTALSTPILPVCECNSANSQEPPEQPLSYDLEVLTWSLLDTQKSLWENSMNILQATSDMIPRNN